MMEELKEWTYSYTCTNCEYKGTFVSTGARKPGVWWFTFVQCGKCKRYSSFWDFHGDKKPRKMQGKTEKLQVFILKIFHQEQPPLTIRHIFYVCANHRLVSKDLSGYRAVNYQIGSMRESGVLPYSWVADNSRSILKPALYKNAQDAVKAMHDYYRRDLWANQKEYIEIWVEKDAMAGVLAQVTMEFGVPLYVARGYSSDSFIWKSAEAIRETGKPTTIYQFGDFDYDGVNAAHSIPKKLWDEHGVKVNFERMAVTEQQVKEHNLPTRPAKLPGDKKSRRKGREWPYDYCVDLDAMPAPIIRRLVEDCITRHIDPYQWAIEKQIEEEEKRGLQFLY